MNAILFGRILLGSLAAILLIGGAGFYFTSDFLNQKAIEVDHARIDAELSQSDINNLKKLEQELKVQADVVSRASQIVANNAEFKFQDKVITDIDRLANLSGVTVTGYTFESPTAVAPVAPTTKVTNTPKGAKKTIITLALKSPMSYDSYLRFLKAIEQNLTRMQVTGVNLSPDAKNPRDVTNPSIGIEVFVKE
jgi:hypothetical protein